MVFVNAQDLHVNVTKNTIQIAIHVDDVQMVHFLAIILMANKMEDVLDKYKIVIHKANNNLVKNHAMPAKIAHLVLHGSTVHAELQDHNAHVLKNITHKLTNVMNVQSDPVQVTVHLIKVKDAHHTHNQFVTKGVKFN